MKLNTKWVVISAIVFGIAMGFLWINFGDQVLDANFGQSPFNWFVAPFILPLIISFLLYFIDNESTVRKRVKKSILFFVIEFVSHWAPFALFILGISLGGGM
jgi:hypothetical protein